MIPEVLKALDNRIYRLEESVKRKARVLRRRAKKKVQDVRYWTGWEPEHRFCFHLPKHCVAAKDGRFHVNLTENIHAAAMEDFKLWRSLNPAPTWWKAWCKLVRMPTHHTYGGVLSGINELLEDAVGKNIIVHLHPGEYRYDYGDARGSAFELEHGTSLVIHRGAVFDGGPETEIP